MRRVTVCLHVLLQYAHAGVLPDFSYIDRKIFSGILPASSNIRASDCVELYQSKGRGYGVSTEEELKFIARVAHDTGIVTDPVYTVCHPRCRCRGFAHHVARLFWSGQGTHGHGACHERDAGGVQG